MPAFFIVRWTNLMPQCASEIARNGNQMLNRCLMRRESYKQDVVHVGAQSRKIWGLSVNKKI